MAKIWPVYEGNRPTVGEPWARLPVSEAIAIFELRPNDFLSGLDSTPRFGAAGTDLTYAGYKHVVVEVESDEAQATNWRPGFYRSRIKPKEAFGRLIRQALVTELGESNVVSVDWRPTIDSQNREALNIAVVIAPNAISKLKDKTVLDALIRLQERLREMGEERTPIVEYATEAELERSASSQS